MTSRVDEIERELKTALDVQIPYLTGKAMGAAHRADYLEARVKELQGLYITATNHSDWWKNACASLTKRAEAAEMEAAGLKKAMAAMLRAQPPPPPVTRIHAFNNKEC